MYGQRRWDQFAAVYSDVMFDSRPNRCCLIATLAEEPNILTNTGGLAATAQRERGFFDQTGQNLFQEV